ncbi:hypothetical protein [Nocardia asiatica]|uniref:hypothetical protein n=1 Tax=Nocardia asiatica TaxID=209252 RepID=UPI002456D396|nr:hypothetical protein [Nocardia asiatica]
MNQHRWQARLVEEVAAETGGHPVITIVRDAGDDAAVTHALLAAHDPAGGVLTVHPTPTTVSGLALAADTLAALGCAPTRTVAEKVAALEPASRAVLAWIYAHRIRHLVVLRAHTLTADQLAWLLRLRRTASLHLVLTWHTRHPIRWGAVELSTLPHQLVEASSPVLDEIILARTQATVPGPAPGTVDLPQVPDTDVAAFLTDAKSALADREFTRVETVYTQAIQSTCAWLAGHTGRPCALAHAGGGDGVWLGAEDAAFAERMLEALHNRHTRVRKLYEQRPEAGIASWHETLGLYRILAAAVADSPGPYTTVTRLRGVQAGFALHGIRLELPPNLAYSVGPGLTTTVVDQQLVDRIRARTAGPAHAAAVAVQLFTGATVKELKALPCVAFAINALIYTSPVDPADPAQLCVWPVPPAARPLLEAALLFQATRPEPSGQLLTGAVGALGQVLQDTFTVTGLTIPARHPWRYGWLPQTAMLWTGRPRPLPRKRRPPQFRRNQPTFQRLPRPPEPVEIEERVYFPRG